jgi:hypothetical protein
MNKMIRYGLMCLLSVYATLGIAKEATDATLPLVFVKHPYIAKEMIAGGISVIQFTIKNQASEVSLPIYPFIEHGYDEHEYVVKRINVGGKDEWRRDCGPSGTLLKAGEECTLTFGMTAPWTVKYAGPAANSYVSPYVREKLVIEYGSGYEGYELEAPIHFDVGPAKKAYVVNAAVVETSPDGTVEDVPNGILSCEPGVNSIESCVDSGASAEQLQYPYGIDFATFIDGETYAYVTNDELPVTRFVRGENNGLSYIDAFDVSYWFPSFKKTAGIAFYVADEVYSYVTSGRPHDPVIKCLINLWGEWGQCTDIGISKERFPQGAAHITFNSFRGQDYINIANGNIGNGWGSIIRCTLDADGDVEDKNCGTIHLPNAVSIAFTQVDGVEYAHVAQWGTNEEGNEDLGGISVLKVNSSGNLSYYGEVDVPVNRPFGMISGFIEELEQLYTTNHDYSEDTGNFFPCQPGYEGALNHCGSYTDDTLFSRPLDIALQ